MNPDAFFLLGSIAAGAAALYAGWMLTSIIAQPRIPDPQKGRFEEARRQQLREYSTTYRWFEPWIDEIAARMSQAREKQIESVRKNLVALREPWRPKEFLAAKQIEAYGAAVAAVAFGFIISDGLTALMLGIGAFFGYQMLMIRHVREQADRRRQVIRKRFASSIELMALMMEVGASFLDALQAVAKQCKGHPLGEELDQVLSDINRGRPRKEALEDLSDRLADDDAAETIFAIVKGEEMGTPLSDILRLQSEQMRLKRSQWAEKASEEAQVAIVFPAMVIMLACLLLVASPFVIESITLYNESN